MARSAKKKEGQPLENTAEMKMWREEFEEMSIDEHHQKLRELGLSDEDLGEFDEVLEEKLGSKKKKKA